jgi:hypothetical protein
MFGKERLGKMARKTFSRAEVRSIFKMAWRSGYIRKWFNVNGESRKAASEARNGKSRRDCKKDFDQTMTMYDD